MEERAVSSQRKECVFGDRRASQGGDIGTGLWRMVGVSVCSVETDVARMTAQVWGVAGRESRGRSGAVLRTLDVIL